MALPFLLHTLEKFGGKKSILLLSSSDCRFPESGSYVFVAIDMYACI